MSDEITFRAALAGTNTSAKCLSVSRDGDAKLVLEVDAFNLAPVLRMLAMGDAVFEITATPVANTPTHEPG